MIWILLQILTPGLLLYSGLGLLFNGVDACDLVVGSVCVLASIGWVINDIVLKRGIGNRGVTL